MTGMHRIFTSIALPPTLGLTLLSLPLANAYGSVVYTGDNCVTPTSITISCSAGDGSLSVTPPDVVSIDQLTVGATDLGQATISGIGAGMNVASQLTVGTNGGVGLLNIQNGGFLNFSGASASIGTNSVLGDAQGVINVQGNGARLNLSGTTFIGGSGSGALNVGSGGAVTAGSLQLFGFPGGALLDVGSGGTAVTDSLSIDSGRAVVEGTMTVTRQLTAGGGGSAGSLDVQNGGVLTFSGISAEISNGAINVTSGGSLKASRIGLGGGEGSSLFVGAGSAATLDSLSVSGTGQAIIEGMMNVTARLTAGDGFPDAILKVQNGGILNFSGTSATIGPIEGPAVVSVSGSGSKLNLTGLTSVPSSGTIDVSAGGRFTGGTVVIGGSAPPVDTSSLNIVSGGTASMDRLFLGSTRSFTSGSALVSDAGSFLNAGNFLGIGVGLDQFSNGGVGSLTLQNGGAASASNIRIGNQGSLLGTGALTGTLVDAGGVINPGIGASFGQLNLKGNLFLQGTLDLGVGGLAPANHDFLQVSGAANLSGGTIKLDFTGGYTPHTGDVIPLVSAGAGLSGIPTIAFDKPPALPFTYSNGSLTFALAVGLV